MKQLFGNGLVYWNEKEIVERENIVKDLVTSVKAVFFKINPAINMFRVETPCLVTKDWLIDKFPIYKLDKYLLRWESTRGTYMVMDSVNYKLPIILYQVNKSFRDENTQSIRLSQYRLREFWQLEFQLFYSTDTKADYHSLFLENFKFGEYKEVDKPQYSNRTTDIEINGVEVASLSTRNDYRLPVFEMSFGLDRLVMLKGDNNAWAYTEREEEEKKE